ncbi:hypothetical protein PhCBS80983_g03566 [Powellomyces hirtus]|uniref:Cyanocobalamin reductase (cyanide-eliminating) n=1 Tax=Powellomyces hirtus TaxID=109895 RepID=A0A507E1X6_9FUNG|nr:hypothetical protein PhCBS80983_g03566 [Powellomyces hirtus]
MAICRTGAISSTAIGAALQQNLAPAGLSLGPAFSVDLYNLDSTCSSSPLPTFPKNRSPLAFLVYNTKELWDPLIEYLSRDVTARLEESTDPVNEYAEKMIWQALARSLPPNVARELRFPHDLEDRFVHFQRLGHLSNLAFYDPEWQFLCVHPICGPWFAFRAVVMIDLEGPPLEIDQPQPSNPCPDRGAAAHKLYQMLQNEVANDPAPLAEAYHKRWRKLVEIRDSIGSFLGDTMSAHRYSEDQLNYHYLKDKKYLRRAIARKQAAQ